MSLRRFYRGEDPIVYEECEMYLHGDNHSLGRQPCIHGYEFHFEEDKEWNVIAEVSTCAFKTRRSTFLNYIKIRRATDFEVLKRNVRSGCGSRVSHLFLFQSMLDQLILI